MNLAFLLFKHAFNYMFKINGVFFDLIHTRSTHNTIHTKGVVNVVSLAIFSALFFLTSDNPIFQIVIITVLLFSIFLF